MSIAATRGERYVSPWAATTIARTTSSNGESLRTYPAAPASTARTTYGASAQAVTNTIRACGHSVRSWRGLDAVEALEADVHQDHVGPKLAGPLDRFPPGGGLADDLDARLGPQEGREAFAEKPVIVHHEKSYGH